ncbi:hypothetical protein ACFVR1_03380 [Psychrobacillus sp. NPDC058041]|uniref:hypothetical protein n=1 Tax=Psychrobacillus sp. NPDC058041 TaxID=3346310 RepID=UPI0036DA024A
MFGQSLEKMIIVVAPDKYKAVAREMTHELSKLENCNTAFWTIKQFEDNEMTIGSKHWVLAIGSSKENKLTSDYLNFIDLKHRNGGLCYGFDGNKAIIFADFNKIDVKETIEVAKQLGLISGTGVITGVVSSTLVTRGFLFAPIFQLILPTLFITKFFKRKKMIKELQKASTSLVADLFLKEAVEEWLVPKQRDKSK